MLQMGLNSWVTGAHVTVPPPFFPKLLPLKCCSLIFLQSWILVLMLKLPHFRPCGATSPSRMSVKWEPPLFRGRNLFSISSFLHPDRIAPPFQSSQWHQSKVGSLSKEKSLRGKQCDRSLCGQTGCRSEMRCELSESPPADWCLMISLFWGT